MAVKKNSIHFLIACFSGLPMISGMSNPTLKDILKELPRPVQTAIRRSAGTSQPTFYRAMTEGCGVKAARRIAEAAGYPTRWAELIDPQEPAK